MGRRHSAATKAKISASLKARNRAGRPATPGKPFLGKNIRKNAYKKYESPYGGGATWNPTLITGEKFKLGKRAK